MRNVAVVIACVAGLIACGKAQNKQDPGTGLDKEATSPEPVAGQPEGQPEAGDGGGAEALPAAPTVEVLEAGAEPREPLRLNVSVGKPETFEMTMTMSLSIEADGQKLPPANIPPMVMAMKAAAAEKLDDDKFKFDSELVNAKLGEVPPNTPPQVVSQMTAELAGLAGIKTVGVMDKRGFVSDTDVTVPDNAPASAQQMISTMKQSIEQMAVPLPEEAIGVGGKWRVIQAPEINGVQIRQVVEYTLTSRKGSVVVLEAKVSQTSPSKFVEMPQAPGMKIEILSWDGSGGGTVTMDLNRFMPTESTLDTKVAFSMKTGGQTVSYDMSNKVELALQ